MMVMKMDDGLDTGPVAMTARVAIGPNMTAGELHDRLSVAGAALMVDAVAALEAGSLTLAPQPEVGATYARKIEKAETRVDWSPRRLRFTTISEVFRPSPVPGVN